jgi:membrane protease YdiL (CAAX protease family)
MDTFNLPELSLIFFFGAFAEEILFRGILQPTLGVWLTSLLFTVIHFRYLKKGYLLIEVFLMGMILGFSYWIAQTVWVPVCCHFFVNLVTAWLVKKGLWQY